jgi:putative salt-induced outer membrane protein
MLPPTCTVHSAALLAAMALMASTLPLIARAEAPPPEAEPAPQTLPTGRWQGLSSASTAFSSGNTNGMTAILNLDLARKTAQSKTAVQSFVNYSTNKVDGVSQTASQTWGLGVQQDRDLNTQWFAFGKLGADSDRMLELNARLTASAGLGLHVVAREAASFDVFAGLSYTDRHYRREQTIHDRTSQHFAQPGAILGEESTHQFSPQVSLKQRLEAYPDLSGSLAHTAKFNGSLNVSVTQTLSLSVGLVSTYNRRVPLGVKTTDSTLYTGLSIKLGS